MSSRPLRAAISQTLLRARLAQVTASALATVPHDTRGAAAVNKADADQVAADRAAEGEDDAESTA